MSQAEIIVHKSASIGWLTFSNPDRRNAITFEMWRRIPEVVAELATDPEVRVMVLRGGGEKTFVSGADISEFGTKRNTDDTQAAYNTAADAATIAIQAFEKPTLAMIRGYCIGGGLALALSCDLRVASQEAIFAIPAARLGLGYRYTGMRRLVNVVGPSRSKDIFYSARKFGADEALAMGLINRVVPSGDLESDVSSYCRDIASNAPLTIKAAKLAIDAAATESGAERLASVDRAIAACFASEDYLEGPAAFREKRPPVFKGR